jgi:hypothetical protein
VSITNHPDRASNQPPIGLQPEAATVPNRGFSFPVRYLQE